MIDIIALKIAKAVENWKNKIESGEEHLKGYAKDSDLPTQQEINKWNNKYDKPSNGIPYNDLDKNIQDMLNDSDTHNTISEVRTDTSELRVEVREDDPESPEIGRVWIRRDM